MSQLRTSSHTLAIEYGRYTRPKTKIEDRKCSSCHIPEDERHFLIECNINQTERENLFSKLTHIAPNSFIWMTKENSFSLCATKTNKYLHGLANSYINQRSSWILIIDTMRCVSSLHCQKIYWVYFSLPVWMHVYRYSKSASTPMNYIFTEFYTNEILRHALSLIVLCITF